MWGKQKKVAVETGSRAPTFSLRGLDSKTVSLEDVLTRGPALLAFFKVSCPVCQLAMPYLERLAAGSGFQLVGISQDENSATVDFNRRFGVTFPTLLDSAKEGYPASNAFGITTVPSLFLVEPDGQVSNAFSGFSKRDLEALGERAGVATFHAGDNVPEWKAG